MKLCGHKFGGPGMFLLLNLINELTLLFLTGAIFIPK